MREGFLARYEGDAQLLVHLQSLEVCTFEALLSQVLADWPTNEPLPAPGFKPALNHSAAVCTPLICRRPYCDSVEPDDIDESLPRGSATMHDTSMSTAMSV